MHLWGGTIYSKGGPGMAAIFGPGGPIILPWTVRGDRFSGGTVHGVTGRPKDFKWAPGLLDFTMLSTLRGKRSESEGNACNGCCVGRFLHSCCLCPVILNLDPPPPP